MFTLKVSNKHPVISRSSFASVFALSPWIIKRLHQVAWDNLPLSSQKTAILQGAYASTTATATKTLLKKK